LKKAALSVLPNFKRIPPYPKELEVAVDTTVVIFPTYGYAVVVAFDMISSCIFLFLYIVCAI